MDVVQAMRRTLICFATMRRAAVTDVPSLWQGGNSGAHFAWFSLLAIDSARSTVTQCARDVDHRAVCTAHRVAREGAGREKTVR
jgi:hypothetical protein